MGFERVAELSDIPKSGGLKVSLGKFQCLLVTVEDKVVAVSQSCPHLGVPLREKDIDSLGIVTCWFHGAQFEALSGNVVRPPLSKDWQKKIPLGFGAIAAAVIPKKCKALTRYAIEMRGSSIWVDTNTDTQHRTSK